MNLSLNSVEKERFDELYYGYGMNSTEYGCEYKKENPEATKQMMKAIVDKAVSRGFACEEEFGRYQINPSALIQTYASYIKIVDGDLNVSRKKAKSLIVSLAGAAYIESAITDSQLKLVEGQLDSDKFLMYAFVLIKTLKGEEVDAKIKTELSEKAASRKVYSFSSASVLDKEVGVVLRILTNYCDNLRGQFSEYDYFISWRAADVVMMSYGLSSSCYSSGGMYMHAPFVLSTMDNIFVGYSNTKNAPKDRFSMRRSRFFGISNEGAVFSGRLYSKTAIKFLVSLLQHSWNEDDENITKIWNGERVSEIMPLKFGRPSYSIDVRSMFPGDGFTYTCDATSLTADLFIPGEYDMSKQLFINSKVAELFEDQPSLKQAYYYCPDCGMREYESSELCMENSLSCCSESSYCSQCDERTHEDDLHYVENHGSVCTHCLENYFFYCECCNEYYSQDDHDSHYTHGATYCQSCYEEGFMECEACGEAVLNYDIVRIEDKFLCSDCAEEAKEKIEEGAE